MNPALAAQILAWLEHPQVSMVYCPGQRPRDGHEVVMFPADASPELRMFLATRLSPSDWHFTNKGLAIDRQALRYFYEWARHVKATPARPKEARKLDPNLRKSFDRTPGTPLTAPVSTPVSPPAGFTPWQVVNAEAVDRIINDIPASHPLRRQVAESLRERATRLLPIAQLEHVQRLRALRGEFPNFGEVIESFCRGLELAARLKRPLKLPATLLLGAPGLGKTLFCKRVAETLGMTLEDRSLAELTAGFVLTGGHASWSNSQPGLIAQLIARTPDASAPALMLDELDKAREGGEYATDRAILGLLESHSAQRFRDESLDLVIDAQPVTILLTANRVGHVRPELLSRLSIAEIRAPTTAELPAILRSIDRAIRRETPEYEAVFAPLTDELVNAFESAEPRQMRKRLMEGYAHAAQRVPSDGEQVSLTLADVRPSAEAASTPGIRPAARRAVMDPPLLLIDVNGLRRVH